MASISFNPGFAMLPIIVTLVTGLGGYLLARDFVRRRLRFVDAVQSPFAPLFAGLVAGLLVWPLALLPVLSIVPVVVFGLGVGLGTASGARLVRRAESQRRQLTP
ncbi:MAG TPA: hypothetical protein VHR41_05460 [Gemmatimonadales bacterium]|nr:hypothetical protein [Gemmatimonadales bacterium]